MKKNGFFQWPHIYAKTTYHIHNNAERQIAPTTYCEHIICLTAYPEAVLRI